jgi:Transposase DDE domain
MSVKHAMNEKLATDRGRTLYERRKTMIEPVFAQHRAVRGFDRFVCRGQRMCATEWKLIGLDRPFICPARSLATACPAPKYFKPDEAREFCLAISTYREIVLRGLTLRGDKMGLVR